MIAHHTRKTWLWLAPLALMLACFAMSLHLLPAYAQATTWYVAPGGDDGNDCQSAGAPCATIAAAIDKARAGDTINLAAGVYTESLTVNKALTFIGANAATTIVDGGGINRILNITGGVVTVQGLTLRNGNAGGGNGGALWTNSPLTLTSVAILTNTAYWGGGVYAEANVVVSDSRVENNTATGPDVSNTVRKGGGGLYVTGNLAVRNTDFVGNRTAGDGGALSIRGNATIIGGSFLRNANSNLSIGSGAAIAITGTLALSGTQVISNTGGSAGGAIVAGEEIGALGGDATLVNSRFQENSSARSSGGAFYTYGSLIVTNTQFLTNTAKTKRGAVNVFDDAYFSGSLFQGNAAVTDAAAYAGAMEVGGALVLTDTDFINNRASNTAGALFSFNAVTITNSSFINNWAGGYAGALEGGYPLFISDSRFEGNTGGASAGAISTYGAATIVDTEFVSNRANGDGAGAMMAGGDTTIRNSAFLSNTAVTYGGAIDGQGVLSVSDSTFRANTAGSYAGAVYLNSSATFTNVVMQENRATGGGSYGGALVNNYNRVTMRGSTVAGNSAAGSGGGIFTDGGVLQIDGGVITGNTAAAGGGLYNATGVLTLTNSYLFTNTATDGGALAIADGAAQLANLVLGGNTATNGAALSSSGSTQLLQSTVASPAVGGGSAIYVAGGTAGITSTIVASYTTGLQQAGGVATADYNLFFGNSTNKSGVIGSGANDVTGDPRFVAPVAGDYQILPGSAALAAGQETGVQTDILGLGRGNPTTIGAYEKPAVDPNNDAYLIDLSLRNVVLNHRFAPTMFDYTASVANRVASIVVTPTASAAGASITVNGSPVGSGAPSAEIPLLVGVNPITTVVTALDGTTQLTYTVVITRRAYDGPFYVDKTVGDDANLCDGWGAGRACLTIAGAIDKASLPDTYVYISGHTYTENLTTTLTMHFVGAGIDSTIVDGGQVNRVFNITGAGNGGSFAAMTIQNGRIATGNGGGIYAGGAVTLTNVAVLTNTTSSGSGGGLYAGGAVSLTNASFISNTANATSVDAHGGALYAGGAANIAGGVYANNWARLTGAGSSTWARGGAIYAAAALNMTGTQVFNNGLYARFTTNYSTNGYGGGVYAGGTATLRDTHFMTNAVQSYSNVVSQYAYAYGGGLYAAGAASIDGGSFAGNTANVYMSALNLGYASGAGYSYGGGANVQGAVAITGTRFANNIATRIKVVNPTYGDYGTSCSGGGLFGYDAVTLAGAEFEGNTAVCHSQDAKGGGVFARGATDVTGTRFKGNFVQSVSSSAYGGGLYVDGTLSITGSQFFSNTNVSGGYTYNGGGGLFANATTTIVNTQFISNTVSNAIGGGLASNGMLDLRNSLFQENNALGSGGGALSIKDQTATVTATDFISNVAATAGAAYVFGIDGSATAILDNTRFIANRATSNDGGAIYFYKANGRITNVLFDRNVANYGAALYVCSVGPCDVRLAYTTIAAPTVAGGPAIYLGNQASNMLVITNTIIANQSQSISKQGGTLIADYNLLYNAPTNENVGAHSLTDADPLFVDPVRGNYRLAVGSPAAGVGIAIAGVTTDLDGKSRGNPPTMGAFEGMVDIYLRSLALSSGALTPVFTRTVTIYTARVAQEVASIVVTPTASSPTALLTVNGAPVASGSPSSPIALNVGPNAITVTVATADGLSTRNYVVTVTRTGASLANLVLSSGPLTPNFAPATTAYTAAVAASVRTVTVTPTAADPTAAITVNGAPVASGAPSGPILLLSPTTTITTVVTAQDGTTIKTYTIQIARPPRADAGLIDLALSYGVLTPGFISTTTSYTAAVDNAIASVAVIATSSDPFAQLSVNGSPATSGQPSTPVTLAVGDTPITTRVTSEDGLVTSTYTITVTRAATNAANPALANLVVDRGPLSPAFAPATTSYSVAAVPFTVTTATITPTAGEVGATIAVSGAPVASGAASPALNLNVGVNTLTTVITAPNGVDTRTYVVSITRDPWRGPFYVQPTGSNSNACDAWGADRACQTIGGAIAKSVLPGTTIYIAPGTYTENGLTSALSLNFVGSGAGSTIVDGNLAGRVFNLTGVTSTVTFQELTVQRGSISAANGAGINAAGALSLTNVNVLSNTIAGTGFFYGGGVYAGGALTLTGGLVQNNNAGSTAGAGGGGYANVSAVISGAQFVGNQATYAGAGLYAKETGNSRIDNTVFLNNAISTPTSGRNGGGAFFNGGQTTITNSRFEGNRAYSGGGLYHNSSGTDAQVSLREVQLIANSAAYGGGAIYDNGANLSITNALLNRNAAPYGEAIFMQGYTAGSTPLDSANLAYTTIVSPAVSANGALYFVSLASATVKNSVLANYATAFTGSGTTYTSDYNLFYNTNPNAVTGTHSIAGINPLFFDPAGGNYRLQPGSPALGAGIAVNGVTTDLDGVTRLNPPSMGAYEDPFYPYDVNLTNLEPESGALAPDFAPRTTRYTVRVANNVTSIAFRPTASSPVATITVGGVGVASGAWSGALPLAVGPNVITTSVTATDTITVKHYVVTVIRTGADLANLVLSSGPLTPAFAPDTTSYTATVPNATRVVSVTPTVADPTATVVVNGVPVTSGTPSGPINLAAGTNVITTVVTAADGTPVKTYLISITRPPDLVNLALSVGTLTPAFIASTASYTAAVGNAIASLAVIPTSSDAGSTITVNGVPVASGAPSAAIPLIVGQTPITTVVTSQDGTTRKTFVVTVTRDGPSNTNATLANLVLSSGPLSPTFASATTGYSATVPFTVTSVTLTPTASEVGATLAVNGAPVTSGSASSPINLAVGVNNATIVITAPNGINTNTYVVAITRLPWRGPFYVDKVTGSDANPCDDWGAGHACATIGGAIAKSVISGTFIYISGHTYSENLTVTLPLNFVGSGIDSTIIDGGQRVRVLNITGAGSAVSLSDLTVQNGLATSAHGGGINAAGALTLTNVTVQNNSIGGGGSGGGIFATGALRLTNVNVLTNTVPAGDGGGIYANSAAYLTNVRVSNNTATRASGTNAYGGGMYARAVEIRGSLFQNNRLLPIDGTNHWGGGLSVRFDTAVITNTQFISNSARAGGGLSIRDNGSAVITGTHFVGNWGNQDGGGIYSEAGSGALRGANLLFVRNFSNNGAAVYFTNSSGSGTINFMTVVSPTIGNGSAIYKGLNGSLTIQNSIVASYTVGVRRDAGTFTSDYNLFYNAPTTEVTGTHSIVGADPRFLDQGADNFRLKAASPAIGKGTAGAGVTTDLDSLPRATPPTMGAYEGAYASPDLSRLVLSQGTLTPVFAPTTTSYTATVGYTTTRLNVTAATVDASATITINSARAISGTAFGPIWLEVGPNPITITVRATNGVTKEYAVVVTRASDGALIDLAIDPGTLTPYFDPETSTYTASVAYVGSPLIVTATASAGDVSSVAVAPDGGGQLACAGTPVRCPLAVGENVVTATVTTIDGATRAYTVTVTRATDATLADLTLGAGTLHPQPFISTTLAYTAAVDMDAAATTVVPTTTYAADTYTITVKPTGGVATACTGAPAVCPLVIGRNAVTITVTATDGLTRTYAVIVSRASDATLSGLELSATSYTPAFISTTLAYTAPVTLDELAVSTYVTTTTTYPDDVVSVSVASSGTAALACSGAPVTCPLAAGLNIITATVTNPNGGARYYTVAVARAPSTNAWPLSLALSHGTLTPAFVTTTVDYTATVPNSVAAVTVTVRTEEPNAAITINGAAVLSGTASAPIPLIVGETVITTVVTAQDLVTTRAYTITVTRASDARLDALAIDPGVLTPAYISTTQAYSAVVTMDTVSTTVTYIRAFASDTVATVVAANGGAATACPDGSPTDCPLALGRNVITLTVTASDQSTRAYVIVVRRPGDASLAGLELSATAYAPTFISTTFAYTGVGLVANVTARTLVTATTTYPDDQVSVTAAPVGGAEASCTGAPVACPLAVGENVITVTVTAADNTVKLYTVGVTRATDATLRDLTLGAAPIYPQPFLSTTLAYTAAVSMNTASTSVIPTTTFASDTTAITVTTSSGATAACTGAPAECPLEVGRNTITVTVTANDGLTREYGVVVRRAGDATLAGLEVAATAYTPAFISTTLTYTGVTVVANATASTFVTATTTYPDDVATIAAAPVGGAATACSGAPVDCPLAVGENVITVTVTAADNTTLRYTVAVTRATDATLRDLALGAAPIFPQPVVSTTLAHTAVVSTYTASTSVVPTTTYAVDTFTVTAAATGGVPAVCPGDPAVCPLAVGSNVITITVTATDGYTRDYTVTVQRAGDATLAGLALSATTYTPAFISTTLAYTGVTVVANATASTFVTATTTYPDDVTSIVAAPVGGTAAACSGAPVNCALAVGENVITVTVTAIDATQRHYTVRVTRASDATLSGLAVDTGALTPAFLSSTLAYTTPAVSHSRTSAIVTATAAYASDAVSVTVAPAGGSFTACTTAPVRCALAVGSNTISVTVTAADGASKDYAVTIVRAGEGYLAGLEVAVAPITPAFISMTLAYTTPLVSHSAASTIVTATVAQAEDVTGVVAAPDGGAVATCSTAPVICPLAVGDNTITVTVTAADGTQRVYTVGITRAPSSDATLASLTPSHGTLTPAFAADTTAYTVSVAHVVASLAVTPTTTEPHASITVSGVAVLSGTASAPIALAVGATPFTVTVTAQDGVTLKHYVVTVIRARSDNADLASLTPSSGVLTPAFDRTITSYTTTVAHSISQIAFTPTTVEPDATIAVAGAPVLSGTASAPIALAVGETVITTTVTAPDGVTQQHYRIVVTRASDASLHSLALSEGVLAPAFISTTFDYTAAAGAALANVVVTATPTYLPDGVGVTVAANGGAAAACPGNPAQCPLAVGANVVTITVTAADGSSQQYIVTITRPAVGVAAVNDAAGTFQGEAVVIDPLANDHDPVGGGLTIVSIEQPAHGAAVIDAGGKTVTYTPDPAFSGADAFTYVAQDANGSRDDALAAVVVTGRHETDVAPQLGLVDNTTGADLNFSDDGFQVDVQAPAGSFTGTLGPKDIFYLVYTPVLTPTGDVHQSPGGLRFGNLVFDLSAYFNDVLLPGYHFPTPLTLTITYDPAQLGGLSEATLQVYFWDGAAWSAEGIVRIDHDLATHTLTFTLAHLSELAFFGSSPTALEPGDEPGVATPRVYLPLVAQENVQVVEMMPVAPTPLEPSPLPDDTIGVVSPQLYLPLAVLESGLAAESMAPVETIAPEATPTPTEAPLPEAPAFETSSPPVASAPPEVTPAPEETAPDATASSILLPLVMR